MSFIIIGAGLYGMYAALKIQQIQKKEEPIIILECDSQSFMRASYINQARVHMGYHYPRSYSTAMKSAHYFDRFVNDFDYCINKDFQKIYATSINFSWTTAKQFKKFCENTNIPCEEISIDKYFKEDLCDGAFLTKEYTYDAQILMEELLNQIKQKPTIKIKYNQNITSIHQTNNKYIITTNTEQIETDFLLNATYASINQILEMVGYDKFKIKYELCEIILCKTNKELADKGITVIDGPFLSIMPFGKTGLHSLTSVTFTPHQTCYNLLPTFDCQEKSSGYCSPNQLGNCNNCSAKPKSAWDFMSHLARKYLKNSLKFEYYDSLYSVKPILMASEIDDSRPTLIKIFSRKPTFISVLSGKINTVYDLDEVIENELKNR